MSSSLPHHSSQISEQEERQNALDDVKLNWKCLQKLPLHLKEDRDIVFMAAQQNAMALSYASPELRSDQKFITSLVTVGIIDALKYASDELKKDKKFIKKIVSMYPSGLKFAHDTLQDDQDIVMEAITKDASAFLFASPALKNDEQFLKSAVRRNGFVLLQNIPIDFVNDLFVYSPSGCRFDKEFVLKVVAKDGSVLKHVSEHLRKDRDVVKAAFQEDVHSLQYAHNLLLSEKGFLCSLETRKERGAAVLPYASIALKDDAEFVLEIVTKNCYEMEFASERLQKDREFVLKAVQQNGDVWSFFFYYYYHNDAEIVQSVVSHHGGLLWYASSLLKADKNIVMIAVSNKGTALQFASDELKADRDIVLAAVTQDGLAFQFADATLRGDKDIVLKAVAQNADMLKFALNGLNQDRDCWIAAGLWREEYNQRLKMQEYPSPEAAATDTSSSSSISSTSDVSLLSRVVLSTKFSLHGESTSSATIFTKELSDHEFFKNGPYTIYSPNAFGKSTCDPKWTNIDWPCRGTYSTCEKEARLKTGTPTLDCCWRYSFRWHLKKARLTRGFMIQVVDLEGQPRIYEASKSQYALGDGQNIETLMAKEESTKIFRVYRPRRLNGRGGQYLLNFGRQHINILVGKIKDWQRCNCIDLSECELDFTESY